MKKLFVFAALLFCLAAGAKSPVMKGYKVWDINGVIDRNSNFSGLAPSKDKSRMVGAFNSSGLYWIHFPEDADTSLVVTPLWVWQTQMPVKRDIEAVTIDPKSGDIYYGQERSAKYEGGPFAGNTIYKLSWPYYDIEELVFSFPKDVLRSGNRSLEGISYLGKGQFVVGREGTPDVSKDNPAAFIWYSMKSGEVSVTDVSAYVKQVAEVAWDKKGKCYWVLDGDYDKKLYRCRKDGFVLDAYDISFIENAEALYVDRKRNCVWVGSDEEPSKLYKIYFDNL